MSVFVPTADSKMKLLVGDFSVILLLLTGTNQLVCGQQGM